jgi:hypothetical protein
MDSEQEFTVLSGCTFGQISSLLHDGMNCCCIQPVVSSVLRTHQVLYSSDYCLSSGVSCSESVDAIMDMDLFDNCNDQYAMHKSQTCNSDLHDDSNDNETAMKAGKDEQAPVFPLDKSCDQWESSTGSKQIVNALQLKGDKTSWEKKQQGMKMIRYPQGSHMKSSDSVQKKLPIEKEIIVLKREPELEEKKTTLTAKTTTDSSNTRGQKSRYLPPEVKQILQQWYIEHASNPYPTDEEKIALLKKTGLTRKTLDNWFVNTRIRSKAHGITKGNKCRSKRSKNRK